MNDSKQTQMRVRLAALVCAAGLMACSSGDELGEGAAADVAGADGTSAGGTAGTGDDGTETGGIDTGTGEATSEVTADTTATAETGTGADPFGGTPAIGDGPSWPCLNAACDPGSCADVPECAEALDCMGDCGTVVCALACLGPAAPPFKGVLQEVAQCGAESACFGGGSGLESCGDGECDLTVESGLLCPEDCQAIGNPELALQCMVQSCQAGQCAQSDNCSKGLSCLTQCATVDCTAECIKNTQGGQNRNFLVQLMPCAVENKCAPASAWSVCGDGNCELAESQVNCSQDCGEPPAAYACILDQCDVGFCPDFDACNNKLLCVAGCETSQCVNQCLQGGGGGGMTNNLVLGAVECGAQSGCLPAELAPGAAECGNQECEAGEDVFNCLKDCKPGADQCGNGQCEPGESIAGCPADCQADAKSCVGDCGQQVDNVACHCSAACVEFGSCCSDYQSFCLEGPFACILDHCPDAAGCAAANQCSNALGCIASSDSSDDAQDCKEGQPPQNLQFLDEYIACAAQYECYGAGGGDPTDPPDPNQTPSECMADQCEGSLDACAAVSGCLGVLGCVQGCEADTACVQACGEALAGAEGELFGALFGCAVEQSCLAEP